LSGIRRRRVSERERIYAAKFKQLINEAINAKYAHALLTNSRAQPAWQEKLSVRGKEMTQIRTEFLTALLLLSSLRFIMAKDIKFYSRTPGYSGRVSY
jgi:Na+-transporting NADH:ubiquinone oxidoreductase subunit NqrF